LESSNQNVIKMKNTSFTRSISKSRHHYNKNTITQKTLHTNIFLIKENTKLREQNKKINNKIIEYNSLIKEMYEEVE
jgi:hypothetical protein